MEATEKQIKFMNSLEMTYPANITKDQAKVAIQLKLQEVNSERDNKPAESVKPQDLGKVTTPYFNEKVLMGSMEAEKQFKLKFNPTSMYVSYAKDIFIGLMEGQERKGTRETMILAINLVKQAHEAFS